MNSFLQNTSWIFNTWERLHCALLNPINYEYKEQSLFIGIYLIHLLDRAEFTQALIIKRNKAPNSAGSDAFDSMYWFL